jgi:gamma-glutamylputrescine oxidase
MTLPFWLDSPAEKTRQEVDVAIIGGGIAGAGAAYWLSKRGGLKVALVEASTLASGASGRNAGFILRGIQTYYDQSVALYGRETTRFLYGLGEETQRHLKDFVDQNGNNFDYEPCGSYLLASSLEELENLHKSAELMAEDGFEVEFFKEDPLERDFYGALFNRGDCAVHPAKLVRSLIDASGAIVFENEPVVDIYNAEEGIRVYTQRRKLRCEKLLIATNAYTPLLLSSLKDKIQPVRGQIIVTQPLRKQILDKICYANYGWEYFRQLPDQRFLLGGCRELYLNDEVSYADVTTPNIQAALLHYLRDRFPDVAGVPIDYRWAGTMGFSADGLPFVGPVSHIPGAFFAAACNGHGMGYSLGLSKLLVDMAMDGASPGPFDSERPAKSAKDAAAETAIPG